MRYRDQVENVENKPPHIAAGVDCDGVKHEWGIWIQHTEGARAWGSPQTHHERTGHLGGAAIHVQA